MKSTYFKTLLALLILGGGFAPNKANSQVLHDVVVSSNVFTPSSLTICQGDTVRWTNTGGTHNVNGTIATFPGNPASFGNALSSAAWIYEFVFDVPGSYDYHCDAHFGLGMVGTITVNPADDASFNYSASDYCTFGSDPTPTVTGLAGGTFTSSPGGLAMSSSTGEIDVSFSFTGTYTITYTTNGPCPTSSNQIVTINDLDVANFFYSAATYCSNAADPTPTVFTPGGTFSSTPAGLSINSTSGEIDLSASTAGIYDITYNTAGPCPNSSIETVEIILEDDASFNYSAASYCINEADPTPTISGLPGGGFTSTPAGLDISATTGQIDLSLTALGTYNITYLTSGTCPNSTDQVITITADDATFNYGSATYCVSDSDPTPTITGTLGGTFSSIPAGLSLNTSSGEIDVSTSTPGVYDVTYTITGVCANSSTEVVEILALDDATFSYASSSYCANDPDPSPTVAGLPGGSYSSSPAGLTMSTVTGQVDISLSTPGVYTITYATTGPCPNTGDFIFTINALDDPSFNYSVSNYCANEPDPTPTIALPGGTFSGGVGLVINSSTGEIDLDASTPGFYSVSYTTNGPCPNNTLQGVTISDSDDPTFSYPQSTYCLSLQKINFRVKSRKNKREE